MSVNAVPPTLSGSTILFNTKEEAQAFFDSFVVPSATTATEGVMKQGAALAYTNFSAFSVSNYSTFIIDGETVSLPNQDTFDEVRTKLLAVTAGLNTLIERLRNAGILDS